MSPQLRQVLYPSSARFLLKLFEHLIQLDIDRMIPRGAGRVKFFMKNKSFLFPGFASRRAGKFLSLSQVFQALFRGKSQYFHLLILFSRYYSHKDG